MTRRILSLLSLLGILSLGMLPIPCHAERYALLIGIDKYLDPDYNLNGCIADVHAVAGALQKSAGIRPENMQLLVDEGKTQVTRQAIQKTVAAFAQRIHPEDTVFFFWFGHANYRNGEDRVEPYELETYDGAAVTRTTLSLTELLTPLMRTPCKALLAFFDMHRGDDDGQPSYHMTEMTPQIAPIIKPAPQGGPQMQVTLYSSWFGDTSRIWKAKHRTYFGYYLEQALLGAAADAKGEIHLDNLAEYLRKAVMGRCWRDCAPYQTQSLVISDPQARKFTLAAGLPPGQGGETAISTAAAQSPNERFDAAFQAAAELWLQNHHPEARNKFEEVLRLKPDDPCANLVLAYADQCLVRWDDAERKYRRAVGTPGEQARYEEKRSQRDALWAKDTEGTQGLLIPWEVDKDLPTLRETERRYEKACKLWPKSISLRLDLAAICCYRQEYGKAEKIYWWVNAFNPKLPEASFGIATISALKHQTARAKRFFKQAIELAVHDYTQISGIAYALAYQQDYTAAEEAFREETELYPDQPFAFSGLGYLMEHTKKDYPEAERLYKKALQLAPGESWYESELASLYAYHLDDTEAAKKHFRRALELAPEDLVTLHNFAGLCYTLEDYDEAEKLYRKLLEHDPADPNYLKRVAYMSSLRKDYGEAEKLYHQALATDPKDVFTTVGLADTYAADGEYREAEKLYRRGIELAPKEGSYHYGLAWCLQKEKQLEEARQEAQKAYDLGDRDRNVLQMLGKKDLPWDDNGILRSKNRP